MKRFLSTVLILTLMFSWPLMTWGDKLDPTNHAQMVEIIVTNTPTNTPSNTPVNTPGAGTATFTPTNTFSPTSTPTPPGGINIAQSGTISFDPSVNGNTGGPITSTGNWKYISISYVPGSAGQTAIFAATTTPVIQIQTSNDGTNYGTMASTGMVNNTANFLTTGTSSGPFNQFRLRASLPLPTTTVTPVVFTYKLQN